MTVFRLTPLEVWTLAAMATLPIEPDSALSVWLSQFDAPEVDNLAERGIRRLQAKGYLSPEDGQVPDDLLEALTLLALSRTTLTTILRGGSVQVHAHFAQVNNWLAQYMPEDNALVVHTPEPMAAVAASLLPSWFEVESSEEVELDLPLGAYAMLVTAFELADVRELLPSLGAEGVGMFTRAELVDSLGDREAWLDGLAQVGVQGVPRQDEIPLGGYLDFLVSRGLLQESSSGQLSIGAAAGPLHEVLGDPDVSALTISLQSSDGGFSHTGVFLYGGGRLFQVDYIPGGSVRLRQLASRDEGMAWAAALLAEGTHQPVTVTPWEIAGDAEHRERVMAVVRNAPKFCPYCGAPVARSTAKFCVRCGRALR